MDKKKNRPQMGKTPKVRPVAIGVKNAKLKVQHAPGGIKMRWFINSLSFVVIILAAVIVFVAAGTSSYYYNAMQASMLSRINTASSMFTQYWTNTYDDYYYYAQQYVTNYDMKEHIEVQFLNPSGRIQLSTSGLSAGSLPSTADAMQALETGEINNTIGEDTASGERVMSMTAPLRNPQGQTIGGIRMITSLSVAEEQMMWMVLISIVACLLVFVLVFMSNRYFIKTILEPVMRINEVAREIAAGRYGMRLQKSYDDEIGQLCDAINEMSDEISRAERIKNEFISSVSHELRTPLTAIGGWSETLIAGGGTDPEEVMQGLEIIQKESSRLTRMVEELLDFSRIESGRMVLEVALFDVEIELFEAVYMYQNLLRSSEMTLDYRIDPNVYFANGDRHRMKQVFLNIIDNAAKYGKSGGRIEVSLKREEDIITVRVRDWGAGIPENELPFVKDKFYKGSSKQRGSGIGLAVTDEIVKLHGGVLQIMSKVGEGTAVMIKLPARPMSNHTVALEREEV